MLRGILAGAVVLAVLPGVPAFGSTGSSSRGSGADLGVGPSTTAARTRLWQVTRTTAAPRRFVATVTATSTGASWVLLAVQVTGTGSARRVVGATMADSAHPFPVAYAAGSAWTPCPGAPTCDSGSGEVMTLTLDSRGRAVRDAWYVVTRDAAADVRVSTSGWRVREVAATALTQRTGRDSDAAGVAVGSTGAERFAAVTAKGGRYGSFAWGLLTCATAGVGSATLHAVPGPPPKADDTAECGGGSGGFGASGSVGRAATWHFDGDAAGVGSESTRLLVWDFPSR